MRKTVPAVPAGTAAHRSTMMGVCPVWGSSLSSTSAVFSFSVLVQMQGWQEKYGASYTSRSMSSCTRCPVSLARPSRVAEPGVQCSSSYSSSSGAKLSREELICALRSLVWNGLSGIMHSR